MSNNALFDDADDENQAEYTPAAAEAQAPAQEEQPAADNPYAQAAAEEATPAQAEEVK